MASFWSTSTGEDLAKTQAPTEYSAGGDYQLIPDGSTVMAFIEEAKWDKGRDEDGNPEYIKIKWKVQEPEAVARSVIFQKIWAKDDDPNAKDPAAKRDKALRMLSTIDANAGGRLAKSGEMPTDDSLALALVNKAMVLVVGVWEIGGNEGNWVKAVSSKGSKDLVVKGDTRGELKKPYEDDLDDDIPF